MKRISREAALSLASQLIVQLHDTVLIGRETEDKLIICKHLALEVHKVISKLEKSV